MPNEFEKTNEVSKNEACLCRGGARGGGGGWEQVSQLVFSVFGDAVDAGDGEQVDAAVLAGEDRVLSVVVDGVGVAGGCGAQLEESLVRATMLFVQLVQVDLELFVRVGVGEGHISDALGITLDPENIMVPFFNTSYW